MLPKLRLQPDPSAAGFAHHASATGNLTMPAREIEQRGFAGISVSSSNLACGNCHLQAGSQPYAMSLVGVWGQFPQYRAREGAVDRLEDRINGCMERSMNGRALPPDSREIKAFSSYVRWLSIDCA